MAIQLQKPEEVRPIPPFIDPDRLKKDLDALAEKALSAGAQHAAVIRRKDQVFDPGLVRKIAAEADFPSIHWPLSYPKDDLNEAVAAYEWAIFFALPADKDMPDYGGGPVRNEAHRRLYVQTYRITSTIESAAFYLGYHLSLGLASGNCRGVFCIDEKRCWPLVKGRACVRPNLGRPSMAAAGIDAATMAKKMGWAESGSFPLAGLVLIV